MNGVASYLPEHFRYQACRAIYLQAAGWEVREIAVELEVTTAEVRGFTEAVGRAVITGMREDGYGENEIIRTLGIPSQTFIERYSVASDDI